MYTALYRTERPENFDQVLGQEHIVRILRNQVKSGTVGHAYLFCGTRGTGKTSVARILAKAVNCTGEEEGLIPVGGGKNTIKHNMQNAAHQAESHFKGRKNHCHSL